MEGKRTILFDLDGTLLPIDMDKFIEKYFRLLSGHFADLYNPEYFVDVINKATENMIKNDGKLTNKEAFEKKFFELIDLQGVREKEIWDRFYDFYDNYFPTLKNHFELDKLGAEIVKAATDKNFNIIIATNPLFPRNAITARLEWIDLNPDDFNYITSYEEMHYCKPNINYYREIMDKTNNNPKDCVMVGNDMRDDMVAKKLGIKTFLIEDFMVKRDEVSIEPDWQGTRTDIINHIKNL
ncbi:MAG TPA: HAD family hydrolase [Halanaerobiales bacterium]|nr:HAD family hydrolase [Halanaerobiales bacterium]